ncbi:hypothetical protein BGX26_005721 [Mortierella sp. AD094]|nr:hypothetical protein BGX26_005721 [Mortierella sp. AD094]
MSIFRRPFAAPPARSKQSKQKVPAAAAKSDNSDKSNKRGKGKGHVFTPSQYLDDVGGKNGRYVPKKHIHDVIAHKVNTKFSTDEILLNPDDQNIKNKIETMKKQYKMASDVINRTGSGDLDEKSLKDQVKEICSFYYIVRETWASSWKLNHRKPVQLTGNLTPPTTPNSNHDTSGDDSDGGSASIEQRNPGPDRTEPIPQMPTVTAKPTKRRFDANSDVMSILRFLAFEMEKDCDLKRPKLDATNRRLVLDEKEAKMRQLEAEDNRQKRELERALMEAQVRKINVEIEIEQAKAQAELAGQQTMLEIEQTRARHQLMLDIEQSKARNTADILLIRESGGVRLAVRFPPESSSKAQSSQDSLVATTIEKN